MDIDEFRLEYLKRIRFDAEHNSTDPEEQFISTALEQLEEIGEIMDPYPLSIDMSGKRGRSMVFDAYGYDEADSSIVLLISDFQNTVEKTSLTRSRIDELYKKMTNFIEEAYEGNIRLYCDDSDPVIDVAKEFRRKIGRGLNNSEVERFKFFIITNSVLSYNVKSVTRENFLDRPVELNVWTLERFFNTYNSGVNDLITIKCEDFNVDGIQCLKANLAGSEYDSYLAIVPGKFLADIYLTHGSRLLQGNVRAFLSVKGKINKGIRATIMKEPTSFFTYNNGIAVVARSIELSSDGNYIKSFKDFQIINGGQTTASLASSIVKKDAINELEGVFVPMKLTVLNVDDELTEEELDKYNDITRSISACANSQNPVSDADFFSNHPFHKAMESLSLKFPAPPVNGNPFETVWFYERSRGKWEQEMLKMTETQKNKYQEKYPRKQVVKKEKLAKCLNTIEQNPHQVCAGNAKNMKEFSSTIDKLWESSKDNINEHFFKKAIASVILFDSVDHIVATSDWYPKGGNKAQIVPYTIAKILSLIPKEYDLDWKMIWQRQTLYPALVRQIESMALQTHNFLLKSNGVIVREYAKKAETWKKFRDEMKLTLDDEFFMTLIMKKETKTEAQQAKREHKFNDGIDAALKVYSLGTEYWLKVYSDLEEKAILSSGNRDFIKSIAGYIQRGNLPSNAQAKKLLKIVNDAENEGYVMP